MQKYNVSVDKPLSDLSIFNNTVGLNDAVNNVLNENGTPEDHTLVSRALTNLLFDTLNFNQKNELLDIFQKLNVTTDKPQTYNIWRVTMNNKIAQLRESILNTKKREPVMDMDTIGGRSNTRAKARKKSRAKLRTTARSKSRTKSRAKSRTKSRAKTRV
jgi:hypothetical protein